ncbi:L-proline trans-4-hydroxylase-like isoform X1 [Mytilus trossulus]|uniref:L-proline trans-4-hydroxylase-like isoform X1 n=2 Tax=Mytilus trossulus TaxID=6551 RepID=UPI003004D6D1
MNEYEYNASFEINDKIKQKFDEYGYILVRKLFEPEVINRVKEMIQSNDQMLKYKCDIPDKDGYVSSMIAWNQAGSDVSGMMARCEKVVNLVEKCLGGEVYLYHSKFTMKWPKNGAGFHWHQDYGYWYDYGNLYPDMGTFFVAIDECTVENGCLQLLRGSHKCGRLDHTKDDGQFSPSKERLEFLKKILPLDVVEMKPGDAVFFHCNVLHMSEINTSDKRRIGFPICYNRASNSPTKKHHHPPYSPISKVTNEDLYNCTNITDMTGKDFIDLSNAATIKSQLTSIGQNGTN